MRCEWGPERLEVLAGRWERRKVPGVTPCGTQAISGLWFPSGECSPIPLVQDVRLRKWSFCRPALRPGLLVFPFFVHPVTVTSG